MQRQQPQAAYPPDDPNDPLHGYEVGDVLGRGGFATVFKATKRGKEYAMKMQSVDGTQTPDEVLSEVRLLMSLNHPCIIEAYDVFPLELPGKLLLCIVMQLCKRGDLDSEIDRRTESHRPFTELDVKSYLSQVALAVHFMHKSGILHRDLKPANVFVVEGERIVLGDLGIARELKRGALAQTWAGTVPFMCPELLAGEAYGFPADVWAMGCTLHSVASLTISPFIGRSLPEIMNKVTRWLTKNGYFNTTSAFIPTYPVRCLYL